ncbi:COG3014 family protein [Chitinimonas sp. BJYL2]|uniref:COG3014 family protein n=1 Tax=Chitinimonas sp. BJYL2 TaxID=2976696 RepID=UPI0022B54C0F|nr:hypothetical protein [Chitinimonas sp. BJYL2]
MNVSVRGSFGLLLLVLMTGCASMQSHDSRSQDIAKARKTGGIPAALQQLDASSSDKEELLYNLERGELLRLNQQIPESTAALLKADAKVSEWEEKAKTSPDKLLGMAGAALISERLKAYEGHDYEKVWLSTRLAMNRIAANDLDNARVDIKRTHEREAVIAELRAKEAVKAEQDAKEKGAQTQNTELNGYPVETLNDPEVLKLKNGYQNALSHYLAGFTYEVLGESGLAAPGYRKAIELRPDTAVLEEGLRGLDARSSFMLKRKQRQTDVLFMIEAGTAPARVSKQFTLPIFWQGYRTVSISYPVIQPSVEPFLGSVSLGGQSFKLEPVVDLNVMARRQLKEEMPGMILRNVTRAVTKYAVQKEVEKRTGLIGGLIATVVSVATEQADDRMWRQLPGRVYLARGLVTPGEYPLLIDGRETHRIKIDGQYAVVPLRLYEDMVVPGPISTFGALPQFEIAAPAKPEAKPAATSKKTKAAKPAKPAKKDSKQDGKPAPSAS